MAYANLETTPGSSPQDRAIAFVARGYGSHLAHLFARAIETQHPWSLQAPDIQEAIRPIIEITEQIGVPILIMGSEADQRAFAAVAEDMVAAVDLVADSRVVRSDCP